MNHNSLIAREGWLFILIFLLFTFIFAFAGVGWATAAFFLLTIFSIWFFRNPERKIPEEAKAVLSPADGRVIKIEDNFVLEDTAKSPFKKISIFMNIFNAHVNRVPYSGKVVDIQYRKGEFLTANLDKASELNERNAIRIRMADGRDLLVVQIAGLVARRIVCWLTVGMNVEKGERLGLIRFGSRVEVLLPLDSTIAVKVGDKVFAGLTTIGYLQ